MQLFWPLPHAATGVFQNLIELKYDADAPQWYCSAEPFASLFMIGHARGFAGVSPKKIACCACTFGVETHFSHMYAQFGCFACADNIHVSAQPVAPSLGIVSLTGALSPISVFVWYGHDAPTTASWLLNRSISSDASAQYFLISGFCCFSRLTAASNCFWFSSYGSLIPSDGCAFERHSAASAIWIGLSGTVTLPLYFLL